MSDKYDQIIAAARAGKPADLLDVVGELVRDKSIELVHQRYTLAAEITDGPEAAAEEQVAAEPGAEPAPGSEEQLDELSSKKVIGYAKAANADLDKRAEGGTVRVGEKGTKYASRSNSLGTAIKKMSGTAKVGTTV